MNACPLVLKLDVSGLPVRWISWQDAACIYSRKRVNWEAGEDFFVLTGGMRNGHRTQLRVNTIIAVADRSRRFGQTPHLSNQALFARDHNTCLYCGQRHGFARLSRDHVHPRARGGQDVWENVATACRDCNGRKDCRTPEEAKMPLLAVPYAPNMSEHLILQNRNILADQMSFLSQFGSNRPQ